MPKQSVSKNSVDTISHIAREIKGSNTFRKSISPKVNVIAQLKYELAYIKVAVQRFSHYVEDIVPISICSVGLGCRIHCFSEEG